MHYIIFALLGFAIGSLGALLNWSTTKTVVVALLLGLALSLTSRADEPYQVRLLRKTTLQLYSGTGSLVKGKSGKTYILTNWHVCLTSSFKDQLSGMFTDGQTVDGNIVASDAKMDLCAARVHDEYQALHLSKFIRKGQKVWTRGYPSHNATESNGVVKGDSHWSHTFPLSPVKVCPSRTTRIITEEGRGCYVEYDSTLSTLYSLPGSSGSPVVDSQGLLVGVISSFHANRTLGAGMVRYRDLKSFLDKL